jgi:hypothetical protein
MIQSLSRAVGARYPRGSVCPSIPLRLSLWLAMVEPRYRQQPEDVSPLDGASVTTRQRKCHGGSVTTTSPACHYHSGRAGAGKRAAGRRRLSRIQR